MRKNITTVQDAIDALMAVEDKSLPIFAVNGGSGSASFLNGVSVREKQRDHDGDVEPLPNGTRLVQISVRC